NNHELSILVATGTVTGQVIARKFAPVLFVVSLPVAVNCSQHRRPRASNNQFAADVRPDVFAIWIYHRWINPKKRERGAARFGRDSAGQGSNHDRAGFGLPPRVNYRAATAADYLLVPHPGLRIDRFADRPEQPQR